MDWNSRLYDQKHSFVTEYGKGVLDWLAPQPGERILDVGCGTGHLAAAIADAGAEVVGLDASPEMIRAARENHPAIEWRLASATDFAFDAPFDAVFSNAALHWIHPPKDAARCMAHALRPGGRLALEMGGSGNVRLVAAAIESVASVAHPWYFPSVGEYAAILEGQGLEVRQAVLFDRPTALEGEEGMRNWVLQFGASMVAGVPHDDLERVLAEIERRLEPQLKQEGVWYADYRRLRILAVKPGVA
ncbi:MAG TPA: class I SAM-dependent methyltransferase [Fimbriimonas sp.]